MIIIAESKRWACGRFTVQERSRPDNPTWPVYIILLHDREIGRSFSIPDIGCCEWLLSHQDGIYAPPAVNKPWDYGHRPVHRRGRPTREEMARRAALQQFEEIT